MAGGLMQLIAYGEENVYLTGNPQVTYFKIVYKRHTNFAMESVKLNFNKNPNFGSRCDDRVTCSIPRKGDLIKNVWFETTLPTLNGVPGKGYGWVDAIGHALIDGATLEIGGQNLDRHHGSWMNIFSDLTIPTEKKIGFNEMIGNVASLKPKGGINGISSNGITCPAYQVYVPLQFWFCRNAGLALPLIALKYHDVRIHIDINILKNLILQQNSVNEGINNTSYITTDSPPSVSLSDTSLWVDYIYLDIDEKRRYAQMPHEYLVEQIQFCGDEPIVNTTFASPRLWFNHPTKELIWVVLKEDSINNNQWFNWTDNINIEANKVNSIDGYAINNNPVKTAGITFGNRDKYSDHNRFQQRDGTYFNKVQPFQYHTNIPSSSGINIYSFALEPEKQYPSGQFNASRIDTLKLKLTFDVPTTGIVKIFAVYTQPLLISSGMAGLKWSG